MALFIPSGEGGGAPLPFAWHRRYPWVVVAILTVIKLTIFTCCLPQALAKAAPSADERREVALFLSGAHPKAPGVSDAALLGSAERCASIDV